MTKDELRETLHREMLFYYFAQRDTMLEIRKNESLMSAVWRKMQPYAACGFPRAITESDIEMLWYAANSISSKTEPNALSGSWNKRISSVSSGVRDTLARFFVVVHVPSISDWPILLP